jgi:acetyl-CoA C-acetyltransferase
MSSSAEQVYIVAGAQTDFARNWSRESKPLQALLGDLIEKTWEQFPVRTEQLRAWAEEQRIGIFVGNFNGEQYLHQGHLGSYINELIPELEGVHAARYEAACASGSIAMDAAATKIQAGEFDLALVVGVEVMRTVGAAESNDFLASAACYSEEAEGVPYYFPKAFGNITSWVVEHSPQADEARILQALSEIARNNRENARRNPWAQTRSWPWADAGFFEKEQKISGLLGGTTRLRDCAQLTDGGALLVLANRKTAEMLQRQRSVKEVAQIVGRNVSVGSMTMGKKLNEPRTMADLFPWTRRAIERACKQATIRMEDIDVVELHDCFSVSEYVMLSMFGLAQPGLEYQAVEEGHMSLLGKRPINPSGGLLGCGHPVGASGVRMALNLFQQLTQQAGDFQVRDAKFAAMLNLGGNLATNACFVMKQITL